jgi:hypothetical protein
MNRDFEIKQLLRAYRRGLMSEAAFDEEMTRLEHGVALGSSMACPRSGVSAAGRW